MKRDTHKPTGPSQRMLRVGELVRHALSGVFARGEIEDPLLQGKVITVPEVRMTPDLKLANAYIMPLGGEGAEEIVAALNRHHRFIRGRVAPELDLKFAPDLKLFRRQHLRRVRQDRRPAALRSRPARYPEG
jgi:ribosome-binding factor A